MEYDNLELKQPEQCKDYDVCSEFVTSSIEAIMQEAIDARRNQIIINTNLKRGLPMENINKIAGPIIEAWAYETFYDVMEARRDTLRRVPIVWARQSAPLR